jgi:hypothetical protein
MFFFFARLHSFGLNSRTIESNLLTKKKIQRRETKEEKAPHVGDGFKVHKKI